MPDLDLTTDDRFDGLYLNVANTARGIEPMLDSVFSFLRRKTDFFNGPSGEGTSIAVNKVNEVLQKHVRIHEQVEAKKRVGKAKKAEADEKKKKSATQEPIANNSAGKENDVIELGQDGFDISGDASAKPVVSSKLKSESAPKIPQSTEKDSDEGLSPSKGNGSSVEGKYVWTQTLSEVNVTISLPESTRGRDLNITISKTHLKVALKSKAPDFIVDAPLKKSIICDDSFWTVEDGNRLVINLQKLNQVEWWDAVCVGDPIIDVKKVEPENSKLDELDGDTRQTVEKMMFDQRQKAMGLPTSEEQQKYEMLEKFKKAHPEMDFSNAKFS